MENKDNKKKGGDFSRDKGNVEIVKKENGKPVEGRSDEAVSVSRDGIDVKKTGNLVIGSLNVVANPVKETLKNRNEKHYKTSKFHLVADIILVLVVLALVGSFFVIRSWDPRVDLGIDTALKNDYATSGEVETFEIEYHNPSEKLITNANISVRLPDDLSLREVVPSDIFNQTTNTFEIGNLASGANGKIILKGLVLGEVGSRQVMNFSFSYNVGKKKQNVLDSLVYSIEGSALMVDIDMPKQVYKDVPFRGSIILKNSGSFDLENDIEVVLKDSVVEIEDVGHKDAILNNNAIVLPSLISGDKVKIDFDALADMERASEKLKWEVYVHVEDGRIKQKNVNTGLSVSIPKFTADINVDKKVLSSGESTSLTFDYENNEGKDINDLNILFHTTDNAFRIKDLNFPESSKYEISGSNLVFLEPVSAGESGVINAELVLSRKSIEIDQEVGVSASVDYDLNGRDINYKVYSEDIRFLSDLQIASRGVYYSAQGDQLGIGPLPPIVDVPTRYWIFWEAENFGNDLENLSVSAILPDNVFFTDQKSLIAGKLRYGEISKKVVWSVGEISAEGGKYRAGFEIEFVPREGDVGKIVDILQDIEFSAFDTFAQREISGSLDSINTELEDDSVASGKGTVKRMNVVR